MYKRVQLNVFEYKYNTVLYGKVLAFRRIMEMSQKDLWMFCDLYLENI